MSSLEVEKEVIWNRSQIGNRRSVLAYADQFPGPLKIIGIVPRSGLNPIASVEYNGKKLDRTFDLSFFELYEGTTN